MKDLNILAEQLSSLEERLVTCMKCGMCQAVCPVYGVTTMEADVARGKLALVDNLSHKIIEDPKAVAEKLGRCLLCGSCKANCPSGVPIMDIFLEAKEIVTAYNGLNPIKKLVFQGLLTHPKLFSFMVDFGSKFQFLALKNNKNLQNTACAPLLKKVIGSRHFRKLPKTTLLTELGEINTTSSSNKAKVLFYPGCLGDKFYINVSKASLKILKHHDVGVILAKNMACCGIPAIASGDIKGMLEQTRINLEILRQYDFDYLVTACGSCTSTIKELWPHYTERLGEKTKKEAEEIAKKTLDISDFLINVLKIDTVYKENDSQDKVQITYHDSCHLKKSLNITQEPRDLLALNQKYELTEMNEADRCCGCGGSFTLFHYDLSYQIGQRKRENILDSGAKIVTTGCPACMMQLEDVLSQNNDQVEVKHVVEIYAESLQ